MRTYATILVLLALVCPKIEAFAFDFHDIPELNDRQIQLILREADLDVLVLSLIDASELVRARIDTNLSDRFRLIVEEEIHFNSSKATADDIARARSMISELGTAALVNDAKMKSAAAQLSQPIPDRLKRLLSRWGPIGLQESLYFFDSLVARGHRDGLGSLVQLLPEARGRTISWLRMVAEETEPDELRLQLNTWTESRLADAKRRFDMLEAFVLSVLENENPHILEAKLIRLLPPGDVGVHTDIQSKVLGENPLKTDQVKDLLRRMVAQSDHDPFGNIRFRSYHQLHPAIIIEMLVDLSIVARRESPTYLSAFLSFTERDSTISNALRVCASGMSPEEAGMVLQKEADSFIKSLRIGSELNTAGVMGLRFLHHPLHIKATLIVVYLQESYSQYGIWLVIGVLTSSLLIVSVYAYQRRRDYVKLLQDELRTAHRMQMDLMPTTPPSSEGLDVAGRCVTANHVGGDLFQYFETDGSLSIAVADVTGKAMDAAIPVVMFSGILGNQMEQSPTLRSLMPSLNRSLHRSLDSRTFICFQIAQIDVESKLLSPDYS